MIQSKGTFAPWDEDGSTELVQRFFFFFLLLSSLTCVYARWNMVKAQNVGGSLTILGVFIASLISLALLKAGAIQGAFKFIAVAGFSLVLIRVTLFMGIDNYAFYMVFPIITMIGIPAEAQTEVLKPFEQVNNEYNRRYDGAGLGLAICKQFAELMDGELTLSSGFGKGSTFTLILPFQIGFFHV